MKMTIKMKIKVKVLTLSTYLMFSRWYDFHVSVEHFLCSFGCKIKTNKSQTVCSRHQAQTVKKGAEESLKANLTSALFASYCVYRLQQQRWRSGKKSIPKVRRLGFKPVRDKDFPVHMRSLIT
jgi:hypothetical protein